ncbi:sodium- and chloride-dependent glycine transporter 2 [Caerostris darwini]|uniref:Transporter n=1 Tax=Caerostris darwini TaxID=1538125 RepID=A0AAV4SUU0_9ARAC|nr:sodium- and chloride-dependent glycine transporter 2 [Caerostris darwini]
MVFVEVKVPPKVTDKKLEKEWVSETKTDNTVRETWGSKAEFLLSCIGLAVGIGNVWRFPYLAYQNGGGAFLVAYIVLLLVVGKPHFFAELGIGQFTGLGSIGIWKCFPIARGVGFAMVVVSAMIGTYYNVIMMYTLYYIGQSFRFEVPWKHCDSWWGANDNCYVRRVNETPCGEVNEKLATKYAAEYSIAAITNVTNVTWNDKVFIVPLEEFTHAFKTCNNATQTASEQFWERYVLQLTSGIDELGIVKWDLALTLFICWMLVFLGIMKGIKSSGKVVYFTATFPYVILIILVIYGCTLSGAMTGLKYLFIPEWKRLLEIQVWRAAAEQLLFSLSLGSGCLIMYASYNKFESKLYRDAMFVSSLDFATSLMSGIVIFSVLGHMSTEMGIDISKVAKGGQGLAFVTYPEALARLPVPQLWSVLFFFMLFLLALDSEFSYMENVFTCIFDEYPHLKKKKVYITFFCCLGFFLLGLPCVLQGGQYILNLMDTYGGGVASMFIATIEISALMWGYGADKFVSDLDFMLGFRPGLYWRLCWKYISPLVLWFVLIYSLCTTSVIQYDKKDYPLWADRVGWILVMVSVLQVPIWIVIQLIKYRKNLRAVLRPHPDWGPSDAETRRLYYLHISENSSEEANSNGGIVNLGMDPITDDAR